MAAAPENLQPLHWGVLPAAAAATGVWGRVRSERSPAEDPASGLDLSELTQLFTKAPAAPPKAASPPPGGAPGKPRSVLPLRRANNMLIVLGRVRMPYARLADALLAGSEELQPETLAALAEAAPTADEIHEASQAH